MDICRYLRAIGFPAKIVGSEVVSRYQRVLVDTKHTETGIAVLMGTNASALQCHRGDPKGKNGDVRNKADMLQNIATYYNTG
jgi:hypothetical protein